MNESRADEKPVDENFEQMYTYMYAEIAGYKKQIEKMKDT